MLDHTLAPRPELGEVQARASAEELQRLDLVDVDTAVWLDRLTRLAARVLRADQAQVSIIGHDQVVVSACGFAVDAAGRRSPREESLCGVTVASGGILRVDDAPTHPWVMDLPPVTSGAVRRYLGAPLVSSTGVILGALCVFDERSDPWSPGDDETLEEIARSVVSELELRASTRTLRRNAVELSELYEREREAVRILQQALLPDLQEFPEADVTVRYLPADNRRDVGGDWYDVFSVPDGRLGFVVGDVVGHDLSAAAAMGRLQSLLRLIAQDTAGPATALDRLETAVSGVPESFLTTVAYSEYSASDGVLRYASAGHPPALVLEGQSARWLMDGRSPPLGCMTGPRAESCTTLADGAIVLWFSDGLVERRGEPLDVGLSRLSAAALSVGESSPEEICDSILKEMDVESAPDDVVVVCARMRRRPGPVV